VRSRQPCPVISPATTRSHGGGPLAKQFGDALMGRESGRGSVEAWKGVTLKSGGVARAGRQAGRMGSDWRVRQTAAARAPPALPADGQLMGAQGRWGPLKTPLKKTMQAFDL